MAWHSSQAKALMRVRLASTAGSERMVVMPTVIRPAAECDVAAILDLIRHLAEYERMAHLVTATEERLRETLFGPSPTAEVLLAECDGECAGFAVFFPTYSTFLARPGIYLEDLFVKSHLRGRRVGLALFHQVARIAIERGCGRMDWSVLDWNEPSIRFYRNLGAEAVEGSVKYRLTGAALERVASVV
jgi:GNAT superfamily N-acetyltransferase